jgi:hypothetical protein
LSQEPEQRGRKKMVAMRPHIDVATVPSGQLVVRLEGESHCLSLRKAMVFADSLMRAKYYEAAARVLENLLPGGAERRRTVILLAKCRALLRDFAGCQAILRKEFVQESEALGEGLHSAFVYTALSSWRQAFLRDARKGGVRSMAGRRIAGAQWVNGQTKPSNRRPAEPDREDSSEGP